MITICENCGRERKHYAKDLCISCYMQQANKKNQNFKEYKKKWQRKNKIYWREYMRKRNNIPPSKWRKE